MEEALQAVDFDPRHLVETARKLADRIRERFPNATLGGTARRVAELTESSAQRSATIRRPNRHLRFATALLIAAIPLSIGYALWEVGVDVKVDSFGAFLVLFQGTIESLVYIGVAIAFLVTLEARVKRSRVLRAVHDLRVFAHLVDMHQLDKDPVYVVSAGETTASSPKRTMNAFELNRYLDYCCELLSVLGKIGALYGRNVTDPVALGAVDQIETLTTSLSRKIWQKVTLLEHALND